MVLSVVCKLSRLDGLEIDKVAFDLQFLKKLADSSIKHLIVNELAVPKVGQPMECSLTLALQSLEVMLSCHLKDGEKSDEYDASCKTKSAFSRLPMYLKK